MFYRRKIPLHCLHSIPSEWIFARVGYYGKAALQPEGGSFPAEAYWSCSSMSSFNAGFWQTIFNFQCATAHFAVKRDIFSFSSQSFPNGVTMALIF
jgi:hypothetical protein